MRGRTSLVHYRHMGIADCIADSADSYVDIALRLGTDPAWRGGIVDRIHARSHVLFDDRRAAEAFARFLLEAAGRTNAWKRRYVFTGPVVPAQRWPFSEGAPTTQ